MISYRIPGFELGFGNVVGATDSSACFVLPHRIRTTGVAQTERSIFGELVAIRGQIVVAEKPARANGLVL
jgi:hypothetical protein